MYPGVTSALASWLEADYELTEKAILLEATIQYQISEVAGRNVGVVGEHPQAVFSQARGNPAR